MVFIQGRRTPERRIFGRRALIAGAAVSLPLLVGANYLGLRSLLGRRPAALSPEPDHSRGEGKDPRRGIVLVIKGAMLQFKEFLDDTENNLRVPKFDHVSDFGAYSVLVGTNNPLDAFRVFTFNRAGKQFNFTPVKFGDNPTLIQGSEVVGGVEDQRFEAQLKTYYENRVKE